MRVGVIADAHPGGAKAPRVAFMLTIDRVSHPTIDVVDIDNGEARFQLIRL